MEQEGFKKALGLSGDDEFDDQIEIALQLTVDEPTDILQMLKALCLLETFCPDLCLRVESWTLGGASEKYNFSEGSSSCQAYAAERARTLGGFCANSQARAGQS